MKWQSQNKSPTSDSTPEIAGRILRYLNENPQASDTFEGILHWWLLDRVIVEEEEAVKQALAQLMEENLIIAAQTADSRLLYRLNAAQIENVRKLLNEEVGQGSEVASATDSALI